jgi:ABC-2 type transport system permease protein
MLAIGALFFSLTIPTDPVRWLVFSWVFLLGIASCSLLGIAYTRLIPNAAAAPAVVQPPYLVLQFISGVYFVFTDLPPVLRGIAVVFPLKWLAQGLRYVFLPDWFGAKEQGGDWNLPTIAGVLSAWTVVSLVLALRAFRWSREGAS